MQQILVAEDDVRLAQLIKSFLESSGDYRVALETSGHKVVRAVENLAPALIILDVGLPHVDGISLCRELRPRYSSPILILTARNAPQDQIAGLECGADDYVVKPVEPAVLLARVRALLRRAAAAAPEREAVLTYGALSIDPAARAATYEGRAVELSTHEFDLLYALAKQPGQVTSREFLFTHVYGRPYDGLDRTVDVRISQLRKKLGDSAEQPARIKTIWGRGYQFVADAW